MVNSKDLEGNLMAGIISAFASTDGGKICTPLGRPVKGQVFEYF
jgi:hypothetical protein